LRAHAYWRLKGLEVDLVILNEEPTSYIEELYQELQKLIRTSEGHALVDKPGGGFLRKTTDLSADDKLLLLASARVGLDGKRGSLAAQLERYGGPPELPGPLPVAERRREPRPPAAQPSLPPGLLFVNGFGGFTPDGREYCILPFEERGSRIEDRRSRKEARGSRSSFSTGLPPAPWSNVIANPSFGFLVTESGGGYTWAGNSQQDRLTTWGNDPVSDTPGEAVYLRDEAAGTVWTPTPLPLGSAGPTLVRHGQGYTTFTQASHGLHQELTLFVVPD